ncbi:magnesium/cobalt transporter CorA [Chitinimonas sp. BJYL2]|uniref:magnesium/cobalt transporter CorA n=1 Tax=Chitinimonas sp. BJYL2 TaxID=2976696 RepID=UPI0022B4A13A|nr:magnesium/cobalt transporter CorA [Chitinimonas sp. BJYL2]
MLINCAAYRAGKKIADIPVEDISDFLTQPDCFVWVALKDASPDEITTMAEEFDLHPLAVEDARHGHQRPKIEEYGDMLFCVVHALHVEEAELEVGEVAIFVGKNYILSIRNRSSMGFLNVRERCEREPELLQHGSGFVLYALLDAIVDRYFGVISQFETELDAIEDRLFSRQGQGRLNVEELYELKRKLVKLNHAASPLLEAVSHLDGGRVPGVCMGMQEYFRDVYDHLERIVRSAESLREMLTTAISVNLAMISLDDSAVSKKLAAYAALFAVPTMIAGVYGMNFEHMPELKQPLAYPITLAVMVVIDLALYLRFRRAGWI